MSLNTKLFEINLKVRLLSFFRWLFSPQANECSCAPRRTETGMDICDLTRTPTHKQTIKVNHFLLTSKLKLRVPKRIISSEWCVLMTASSHEYEMQTRPEGHYCLPRNHYQLSLSYKSSFSFSQSVFFPSVSGGLLILAPFTLGWTRWARLLALSMHLVMWNWSCFVACGFLLSNNVHNYNWHMFVCTV